MGCCASTIEMPEPIDYEKILSEDKHKWASFIEEKSTDSTSLIRHYNNEKLGGLCKEVVLDDGTKLFTLWQFLANSSEKHPEGKMLATRPWITETVNGETRYVIDPVFSTPKRELFYNYLTYTEKLTENIGKGFIEIGNQKGGSIGFYSHNTAEYQLCLFGSYSQTMINVPIYDTLTPDACQYIINHAECNTVVVHKKNLSKLADAIPECKCLKNVVQFDCFEKNKNIGDKVDDADKKRFSEMGITLYGLSEIISIGEKSSAPVVEPQPEDLAIIMYTSGTTGQPKGVMLSHANIVSAVQGLRILLKERFTLTPADSMLSYLPLAHIFENVAELFTIVHGATVCYFNGNIKQVAEDLTVCQPTFFCGVPRIFQRFYDKVLQKISLGSSITKWLFNQAIASAVAAVRGEGTRNCCYESIIMNKIRAGLGFSNIRFLVSGSAPLSNVLKEFLVSVCNAPVIEGYGLTETCAALTLTSPSDLLNGHVGCTVPCNEYKLVDVPEMNYFHHDKPPRGEIVVKGNSVFLGYFKNPEKTAEEMKFDWFFTGDIGRLNDNGTLTIIDRKKNIFKLAQGEYIAAEQLEIAFCRADHIGQIWIYGNSFKNSLIAICVPAAEPVIEYAKKQKWIDANKKYKLGTEEFSEEFNNLCQQHSEELLTLFKEEILAIAKIEKYPSFKIPKGFIMESKLDELLSGFNMKNDTLGPTFKLKRPQLLKMYQELINAKYSEIGEP